VVRCGLEAGCVPEALFVAAEARGTGDVEALIAATLGAGSRVYTLGRGVAERVADTVTAQAVSAIFPMTDVELGSLPVPTLAIVCVDVRDPGNAGTVLRTADAAGADVVICCAGTVDVFNPKTVRSSAGSIFHVPVVVSTEVEPPIAWLRSGGVTVYGTAATGTDYAALDLTQPSAFVLGNESAGLSEGLLDSLGHTVAIPMGGRAESLNVGVACAVLCFEAQRQRRAQRAATPPPTGGVGPAA